MIAASLASVSVMCHSPGAVPVRIFSLAVHVRGVAQRLTQHFPAAVLVQATEVAAEPAGVAGRSAQLFHLVDDAVAVAVEVQPAQDLHVTALFALAPQGLAGA